MLIVVVTIFVICWGPILINNLLVGFNVTPSLHTGVLKPLRKTFFLLCYLNSCMNPIIYAFMSKNFRDSFKLTCLACFRRKTYKSNSIGMHRVTSRMPSVSSMRDSGNRIYISASANRVMWMSTIWFFLYQACLLTNEFNYCFKDQYDKNLK